MPQLPDPGRAWLALAMSSTLAGNVTILGSITTLIVVEGARKRGRGDRSSENAGRFSVPLSLMTITDRCSLALVNGFMKIFFFFFFFFFFIGGVSLTLPVIYFLVLFCGMSVYDAPWC